LADFWVMTIFYVSYVKLDVVSVNFEVVFALWKDMI